MAAQRIAAGPCDAKAQFPRECPEKTAKRGKAKPIGPRRLHIPNVTTAVPRNQQFKTAI
jgi:hypothetical protein